MIFLSLLGGVMGFMVIEGYSLTEAIYMTSITVSTVGFNEVNPLTENGRLFTSIYILLNLGIFAYVVSTVTTYIFEGELQSFLKRYQVDKKIKKLKNHVIVCGYGRNGMRACEELFSEHVDFLIIEQNQKTLDLIPKKYPYHPIIGDATHDEVLKNAGIMDARALITTLPRDSDNVYITLSAKELKKDIFIVSRASEEYSETKLTRAGADKVIMPDAVGGMHMAQLITKPYVIEFLDLLSGASNTKLSLEEYKQQDLKSEYQNKSIRNLDIRKVTNATIVGLKRKDKGFMFNPAPDTKLTEGDVLILLGEHVDLIRFKDAYT